MGIYTDSYMMVGIPYKDLPKEIRKKIETSEFTEENELDCISLYYDAAWEEKIIGNIIDNYVDISKLDSWVDIVKKETLRLEEILKVKPKLIATHSVC